MSKPRYITIPENWNELTPEDWRQLLKMRQQMVKKQLKLSIDDVRIETARMLLQNRGVKLQLNNRQYLVLIEQLSRSLTWLWREVDDGIGLVYRSLQNKIPTIRGWLGPSDYGEDITFGEFRQAVAHLRLWEQTQKPQDLQALGGLLYRPEASKEQKHERQLRRQPYDWDSLDDKIARGARMQPWQLWGIYAWFAYFCEYLTTGTFILDGVEVRFSPIFQTTEKKEGGSKSGSLQQICLTLAESHVFGTAREVDNTQLLVVMQKLLQDYEQLMRIKEQQIKKQQKK